MSAAAVDIDEFYHARVAVPAPANTLLVLSVDAKGIVMRPDGRREPTRAAAHLTAEACFGHGLRRSMGATGMLSPDTFEQSLQPTAPR